jgi:hypothetical protein
MLGENLRLWSWFDPVLLPSPGVLPSSYSAHSAVPPPAADISVCPGSLDGFTEPSQHEADRGKTNEGECFPVQVLPILGQAAAAIKPSNRPLDDPSLWEDDEALGSIGALDDLQLDAPQDPLQRRLELRSLVAGVGVQLAQEREQAEQGRQQQRPTVAVLDVGGMHDDLEHQALGVYQQVAFLALDFLAGIVARRINRAPPFSALLTLWLSLIAAVGLASRPACSRHCT